MISSNLRSFAPSAVALLAVVPFAGPVRAATHREVELKMGSRFEVTAVHPESGAAAAAVAAAWAEIDRIEALISSWREDSETSALNRSAGKGPAVSPELFRLIRRTLKVSALTDGWVIGLMLALAPFCGAQAQTNSEDVASTDLASAGGLELDILFNYYEQDGENSPVTGGVGTEEMDVLSPIVVLRWGKGEDWKYQAQLGVDAIASASTDNIDLGEDETSGASRLDARAYTSITATRALGNQDVGFTLGFSGEYDYQSIQAGLNWSRSFRQQNTTVSAALNHYQDNVELYGIDGVQRGEDDRSTTDVTLGLSQVIGSRTVFSGELFVSSGSGFLSTPFHEVLLADGQRIAERLPDSRTRTALGLRLHHTFSDRIVGRLYYRLYDDDWNVQAHTFEVEPHFKVSPEKNLWVFPIARIHTQDASEYFGLPGAFSGTEEFLTADRDLSEFTSDKLGVGFLIDHGTGGKRRVRWWEARITAYSRDDGLDALSASFGMGLRF